MQTAIKCMLLVFFFMSSMLFIYLKNMLYKCVWVCVFAVNSQLCSFKFLIKFKVRMVRCALILCTYFCVTQWAFK